MNYPNEARRSGLYGDCGCWFLCAKMAQLSKWQFSVVRQRYSMMPPSGLCAWQRRLRPSRKTCASRSTNWKSCEPGRSRGEADIRMTTGTKPKASLRHHSWWHRRGWPIPIFTGCDLPVVFLEGALGLMISQPLGIHLGEIANSSICTVASWTCRYLPVARCSRSEALCCTLPGGTGRTPPR